MVLGATGLVGGYLVDTLDRSDAGCRVRLAARDPSQVERCYWLSSEVANGEDLATIFSGALGRPVRCDQRLPHEAVALPGIEPLYAAAARQFLGQVYDGRMGYIGTVYDDGPFVTGRPSTTLAQWAAEHREQLAA